MPGKKVGVEDVKATSHGLRGTLPEELANGDAGLTEAAKQLIKFHGVYQQQDRDARKEARGTGAAPGFQFMIRSKLPGGQLTAAQYLTHDDLADRYANGTLRITTRQGFQFHGVIKGDLHQTIRELNGALVTTFGACGDIVRNVMSCPAPTTDRERAAVEKYALALSKHLTARTSSYHQLWINGEQMIVDEEIDEPIYGRTYLPRKFKIGVAYPGDNCIDVFTQDVGLIALFEGETLAGFNVTAGGGMGMTHNNDETFARLGDVIAFVEPEQVIQMVEAIVTIHRDFGDRTNRKHARLKYVLADWGVARFCEVLQERLPFALQEARPMPEFKVDDHLGWNEQGDSKLFVGIPVENGRIADRGSYRLRSGLRAIVERFSPSVRLTAQQNILLCDLDPTDREGVESLIAEYSIKTVEQITAVRRNGLACPALPTCGLALSEAERALPTVLDEIEEVLADLGIPDEAIAIRMTGCPNGCARPYVAELAFVGRTLDKYTVFLGGSFVGTRLAEQFLDLVPTRDLAPLMRPVFAYFRDQHRIGESFGDFCYRVGLDELRAVAGSLLTASAAD